MKYAMHVITEYTEQQLEKLVRFRSLPRKVFLRQLFWCVMREALCILQDGM